MQDAIRTGKLVPLLEEFNPGDVEEINAVFVGGGGPDVVRLDAAEA